MLLSAEIISVTKPSVDLAITKSHMGNFFAGFNGDYTISVSNNGPEAETNPIVVDDTLPAGLTFVSASNDATNDSSTDTTIVVPALLVTKTVQTLSDPENGTVNPKAIPGAVARYTTGYAFRRSQVSGVVDGERNRRRWCVFQMP